MPGMEPAKKDDARLTAASEKAKAEGCSCMGTTFRVHSSLTCPVYMLLRSRLQELESFEALLARSSASSV